MSGIGFGTPIEPQAGGPGAGGALDTARRGSRRRNALISAVCTVAFFAAVAGLQGFEDSFDPVVSGFWLNVKLMLVSEAFVLALGLLVAVIRSLPRRT